MTGSGRQTDGDPTRARKADKVPKWLRAREWILEWIEANDLEPGSTLPSVQAICRESEFKVQPVRRAMDELGRAGMIRRRAGAPSVLLERESRFVDPGFSFSAGENVRTKVVELTRRQARLSPDFAFEQEARKSLGVGPRDELLVIARLRFIEDRPRVLHRSYLNPALFPADVLGQHDLANESLIAVFNRHGYQVSTRDTRLTARFPTNEERSLLRLGEVPVLCADQSMWARAKDGRLVTIEYLNACYVDWEYRITNRRMKKGVSG